MLKRNLIKDLRQFGLNEYESKVYLALTTNGPSTASVVSEKSGVPHSKVYEVMRSLIGKSLVESWISKPQTFKAVEPAFALKKLIEQKKKTLYSLEEKSNRILSTLKSFKKEENGFWAATGKKAFLEKGVEILERTEKLGLGITDRFSRYPLLDNALLNALKRGVEIKMLGVGELDEAKLARLKWYSKVGAEIKLLNTGDIKPILGIGDNKEACIRFDHADDCEFIWSSNGTFVNILRFYFDSLWKSGKEIYSMM